MTKKWTTIYLNEDSPLVEKMLEDGMTVITYKISNIRVREYERV